MPRLPQRPSETVNAAADKALDVSTKAIGARPSHSSAPKPWPLLYVLGRAGRLTFDAALLIVFAPVIAIWWLTEKRHKR